MKVLITGGTGQLGHELCDLLQQYRIPYLATSRADIARTILLHSGQKCHIRSIRSEEFASRAKRPNNSRLSKESLIQNGFEHLSNWQDALARFFNEWQLEPEG